MFEWMDDTDRRAELRREYEDAADNDPVKRRMLERADKANRERVKGERLTRIVMTWVVPLVIVAAILLWAATNAFGGGDTNPDPAFSPDDPPTCVWHTGMGEC